MESVVEIKGVSKYYQNRSSLILKQEIQALDALNLTVEKGSIFGLLGPNGAGKSTTLNLLCGLLRPSSGAISLFSQSLEPGNIKLLSRIGYLPEENMLPDYVGLLQLLRFLAQIFQLSPEEEKKRLDWLIEQFQLKDLLNKRISSLSSGQKRVSGIACALFNQPELLVLDEPTVYLDPWAVKRLSAMLIDLKSKGATIIISSHILSQIEKLCDRIGILDQGRLKFVGDSKPLLEKHSLDEVFFELIPDTKSP